MPLREEGRAVGCGGGGGGGRNGCVRRRLLEERDHRRLELADVLACAGPDARRQVVVRVLFRSHAGLFRSHAGLFWSHAGLFRSFVGLIGSYATTSASCGSRMCWPARVRSVVVGVLFVSVCFGSMRHRRLEPADVLACAGRGWKGDAARLGLAATQAKYTSSNSYAPSPTNSSRCWNVWPTLALSLGQLTLDCRPQCSSH